MNFTLNGREAEIIMTKKGAVKISDEYNLHDNTFSGHLHQATGLQRNPHCPFSGKAGVEKLVTDTPPTDGVPVWATGKGQARYVKLLNLR